MGGMVVRATAAGSGFVTPGSTPLLSVGESVFGQSSLSRRASVPMTDYSKFVRGPPFPERGLEGKECDFFIVGEAGRCELLWGVVERCRLGSVGVAVEESCSEDGAIF